MGTYLHFANDAVEDGAAWRFDEIQHRHRNAVRHVDAYPLFFPSMNASTLRVCVVLGLFALAASRGEAVTIIEPLNYSRTNNFYGSAGSGGDGANIGTRWVLPSLSPDLYFFNTTIGFTTHATAYNPNPFDVTVLNNTFLYWTPNLLLVLPSGRSVTVSGQQQGQSISAMQGPHQGLSLSLDFTSTLNLSTMITPGDLVGSFPISLFANANLVAGTQYGGGTHVAALEGSFTIASVPDGGSTLGLAAATMFSLMLLAHRGRKRSLPTLVPSGRVKAISIRAHHR